MLKCTFHQKKHENKSWLKSPSLNTIETGYIWLRRGASGGPSKTGNVPLGSIRVMGWLNCLPDMRRAPWCRLIQTLTNVIQYMAYLNIYKTWVGRAARTFSCEHDGYLKLRTASVSLGIPFLPKVRESGSPPTVPSQRDVARGTWHNSVSSSTVWLIGMKNKLVYLPFRLGDFRPFLLPRLCIPVICAPCQSLCSSVWPVELTAYHEISLLLQS